MKNDKSLLCLILARGGSKGLTNKNIKILNGKPLIYYTIKAVKDSNLFDRIILSTDSQEIADVAKSYGIDVPFLRPDELASDKASAKDVIRHALKWVKENDKEYDYVQYIFPTAPLRTNVDIENGVELLFEKNAEMIISVCETDHPIWWANVLPEDHSLKGFVKQGFRNKNRQDLPKSYRVNGSIFFGKWDIFYEMKDWLEQDVYAYVMPKDRSIDIDTLYDFKLAEFLLKDI